MSLEIVSLFRMLPEFGCGSTTGNLTCPQKEYGNYFSAAYMAASRTVTSQIHVLNDCHVFPENNVDFSQAPYPTVFIISCCSVHNHPFLC